MRIWKTAVHLNSQQLLQVRKPAARRRDVTCSWPVLPESSCRSAILLCRLEHTSLVIRGCMESQFRNAPPPFADLLNVGINSSHSVLAASLECVSERSFECCSFEPDPSRSLASCYLRNSKTWHTSGAQLSKRKPEGTPQLNRTSRNSVYDWLPEILIWASLFGAFV